MKLCYILLAKEVNDTMNTSIGRSEVILELLDNCVSNIDENYFLIDYKGENHEVEFCIKYEEKENSMYLDLNVNSVCREKAADIIDYLRKEIDKIPREDIYIICSLDEASAYYCSEVYPLISEFERRLRKLTYSFMTRALGSQWYNKTFNEEQQKKVKENLKPRGKNKLNMLIEQSLNGLDWYDLTQYLFMKRSIVPLAGKYVTEELQSKTKEELIKVIQEYQPSTIWEKYIMSLSEEVPKQMEQLRIQRNKIAHSKIFTKDDYQYCISTLPILLELINEGEKELEKHLFTIEEHKELVDDIWLQFGEGVNTLSMSLKGIDFTQLSEMARMTKDSINLNFGEMMSVLKSINNERGYSYLEAVRCSNNMDMSASLARIAMLFNCNKKSTEKDEEV